MASIRRAQSPYHNGGTPFSVHSPSQKHLLSSSPSPIAKLLASLLFFTKPPRKFISWKKALYRCILFFFLGFLLGMANFNYFNDLSHRQDTDLNRLSFENDVSKNSDISNNDDVSLFPRPESLSVVETVKLEVDRVRNVEVEVENVRKELIVVTPTFNRGLQSYYLNRLGQVLRLVKPPLLWIVVEMSVESLETAELLRKTGVMYRHLVCGKNLTDVKDRGVHQRNRALEHIELHKLDGIVYFADDDNIYSLELFESLRNISRFGTWPVAMLAQSKNKAVLEGPVCSGSEVVGWHTNEKSKRLRRFHVDMSGFAFNSTILWDPKRWKRPTSNPVRQLDSVKEGFQETTFIEQVVEDERQMEGIPHGCSKIMNWHLHLDSRELDYPKGWVFQKNLDVVLPAK